MDAWMVSACLCSPRLVSGQLANQPQQLQLETHPEIFLFFLSLFVIKNHVSIAIADHRARLLFFFCFFSSHFHGLGERAGWYGGGLELELEFDLRIFLEGVGQPAT
jgi:hypothetical protein